MGTTESYHPPKMNCTEPNADEPKEKVDQPPPKVVQPPPGMNFSETMTGLNSQNLRQRATSERAVFISQDVITLLDVKRFRFGLQIFLMAVTLAAAEAEDSPAAVAADAPTTGSGKVAPISPFRFALICKSHIK